MKPIRTKHSLALLLYLLGIGLLGIGFPADVAQAQPVDPLGTRTTDPLGTTAARF